MATNASVANGFTIMNTTQALDLFCVKLYVGPLVWGVFSVPSACVGIPASVWLLWVLIQRQRRGSSNNIYMLNLTVTDLIYNLFKLPSVLNYFLWRDIQCSSVFYILEGMIFICRPLFIACCCVDCYMAVVHPIRYMRISQARYKAVVCVVVWAVTLAYALLFTFVTSTPIYFVCNIPFVLSMSVITFCDVAILRTLRKPDPSGRTDVHPLKQRARETIVNSFIMTVVSCLPTSLFLMLILAIPLGPQELMCHVYFPSLIFSRLGSTVLPMLYLGNLRSFSGLRVCHCV